MIRRTLIFLCLLPAVFLANGCQCFNRVYQPTSCYPGWDPVLGSCDSCGVCGGDCVGHTPSQHLKHTLTCAAGCGDIYWGEWISDPPDKCDPCDNCGNFVGPQPCPPGFFHRVAAGWHSIWGYRSGGACCGAMDGPYDASWEVMKDGEQIFVDPEIMDAPLDSELRRELAPAPTAAIPQAHYPRHSSQPGLLNLTGFRSQRFAR